MARAERTTVKLRNGKASLIALLVLPNLLSGGGIAAASPSCGADFLFPTKSVRFFHLDTINVTYRSGFTNPTLSCWCGASGQATQKLRADNVSPFNGSALVLLSFSSDDPCWFQLASGGCAEASAPFLLLPNQRPDSAHSPIIDASTPDLASPLPDHLTLDTAASPLIARTSDTVDSQEPTARGDNLSPGAKAALGIGIALTCVAIGAMAAFLYFRRRRRRQDADLAGAIVDHDRRHGRKGPEKRNGGSSVTSGRSDEPLCPIQPVFDGYPGSMGYDDVRSLPSATNSHSPGQSPTLSHNGGFWTYERSVERDELTAARLKSKLQPSVPTVVSYGPNPVTPTLTPRATSRVDLNAGIATGSPDVTGVPMLPVSDYTSYSIPPPSAMPELKPSPPKKPAVPIVVSYGPNKVTPTPLVVSPTVPPDEAIVNRRFMDAAGPPPAVTRERQFSWEADSPLLGPSSMGPLPPYVSTADFEAMEKGAVRKLAEPQAQAELPPTKEGFYPYMSDIVAFELSGAAPQNEPQLPYHPYKPYLQAGPSGRHREIDEQKFLLSDVEITKMRAEKAKARATAAAAKTEEESYDLGEPLTRR
ncbi:hypothetical protein MFIFM68171_10278 [Madurella fahalii]|uniref:Uncharacterized protein n=1 Tax=Madurella fahalii TaxID=1157608 RepID=A0ABQ0GQP6_9PEZI